MAHSRVWNSACRGVKTRLLANEPNVVTPSSVVKIIPPPKRLSSLCQEASIVHFGMGGGGGRGTASSTIASSSCGFSMIWASFQLSASDLARWMVSSGVMSLPLKALSLRAFHMNQLIHGTVAMILSGIANSFARHRTWFRLLYIELHGNIPGRRGISARGQAWIEGRAGIRRAGGFVFLRQHHTVDSCGQFHSGDQRVSYRPVRSLRELAK